MVSTYELLKEIENTENFATLLKRGVIPISILNKKCYYEKYKEELKINSKVQSISNVSEDFNVSEMTVRRAIKFME